MHDVGGARREQAAQRATWRRLGSDLRPMSSSMCSLPAAFERGDQAAAGGDHERTMAGPHQRLARFRASSARRRRWKAPATAGRRSAGAWAGAGPQSSSTNTAPQYGHFAEPVASTGRYTRGCEFHSAIAGVGQLSGSSRARHRVAALGVGRLRLGSGHARRPARSGRHFSRPCRPAPELPRAAARPLPCRCAAAPRRPRRRACGRRRIPSA